MERFIELEMSTIAVLYKRQRLNKEKTTQVWRTFKDAGYNIFVGAYHAASHLTINHTGATSIADVVRKLDKKGLLDDAVISFAMKHPEIHNPGMRLKDVAEDIQGLEKNQLSGKPIIKFSYWKPKPESRAK